MRSIHFAITSNRHHLMNNNSSRCIYSSRIDMALFIGDHIRMRDLSINDNTTQVGSIIDVVSSPDAISITESSHTFISQVPTNTPLCLIQIWASIDINKPGYIQLSGIQSYNLRGICEISRSNMAFWCTIDEILGIVFIFNIHELEDQIYPAMNGVYNCYYTRFYEVLSSLFNDSTFSSNSEYSCSLFSNN